MRNILTIIALNVLLMLAPGVARSQEIFIHTGYAGYKMEDLKMIQDYASQSATIKAEKIVSFPSYIDFEGGARMNIGESLLLGIALGYGSTGARSSYADYSGSIRIDQLAQYGSISFITAWKKYVLNDRLRLTGEFRSGLQRSKLFFEYEEIINGDSDGESLDMRSLNILIQPNVIATWKWKFIGLELYLGYAFTLYGGEVNPADDTSLALINPVTQEPAIIDWAGFRIGGGIVISLK